MSYDLLFPSHPELVIGIAGPIGIDIDALSDELTRALGLVSYRSSVIHVTKLMSTFPKCGASAKGKDFFSQMNFKMDHANALCKKAKDPAFLMRIAMDGIREKRKKLIEKKKIDSGYVPKRAYIIRQLKRPQEVDLLRRVYGKQFILVSGYGARSDRKDRLFDRGKEDLPLSRKTSKLLHSTEKLLQRDHDEATSIHGQHLRDTFHRADVFVDGIKRDAMREGIERFIAAFFGDVTIGPTRHEYGMYAAKAAALRSTDLSRQVGAAAFSTSGEIITQGCNEVPRAFGGTYWSGESPDFRDVKLGYDPNDALKKDVLRDLLEKLKSAKLLKKVSKLQASSKDFVEALLGKGKKTDKNERFHGALKDSHASALTEYGRVIHAEMSVVTDAARTGRALKDSTLYVTTFPCHNCTKHIIGSGIRRVYFLEPYPKSRAKELHDNEIVLEEESEHKVSYLPFLGISPFRYRDIFEKSSRKSKLGLAKAWYAEDDKPRPLLPQTMPTYLELEEVEADLVDWDL